MFNLQKDFNFIHISLIQPKMYTGEREGFGNFGNKNAIKHEKGSPP
jgi:hypothetical protein